MSNKFYHYNSKNKVVLNNYDNILSFDYMSDSASYSIASINFKKFRNIFGSEFMLVFYVTEGSKIWIDERNFNSLGQSFKDLPEIDENCLNKLNKMLHKRNWGCFFQFAKEEHLILAKVLLNV